jgi:hypothetical protein
MKDHVRVTMSPKMVTTSVKSFSQVLVVIDLTVENQLDRSVLIGHRLSTSIDVDNREPSLSQGNARLRRVGWLHNQIAAVRPLVIRATVRQLSHHGCQCPG